MERTEQINKLAEGVAESMGLEIVDVQVAVSGGGRHVVRIFIYKPQGITVDDCAQLSRQLDVLLEAEMGEIDYVLEVSSPGLDKPLKTRRDFERNIGKVLDVNYWDESEKNQFIHGKLEGINEDKIVLAGKSGKRELAVSAIVKAKIDVQI